MTGTVICMKTRQPLKIVEEPREPTDAERVESFALICADQVWLNALKIKAVKGLDAALRVLHAVAGELKGTQQ